MHVMCHMRRRILACHEAYLRSKLRIRRFNRFERGGARKLVVGFFHRHVGLVDLVRHFCNELVHVPPRPHALHPEHLVSPLEHVCMPHVKFRA